MKTTELRIGNLVRQKVRNNEDVCVADFITIQMAHNYVPIPLTEEWLLKFGFTRKEYIMLGEIHFDYCLNNLSIELQNQWIYFKKVQIERKSLFVHELQNLYFALTGEEL
jgi:hypothetical protein